MEYKILESSDRAVCCIGAVLGQKLLVVGILCIRAEVRYGLTERTSVVLFDQGVEVCTVELIPAFKGDKNGYLSDVALTLIN